MQKKKNREMRLLIKFPLSLGKSVLTFMWHKLEQKTDLSRKTATMKPFYFDETTLKLLDQNEGK